MRRAQGADALNSPSKFSARFRGNDGSQRVRGGDNVEDVSQEEALQHRAPPQLSSETRINSEQTVRGQNHRASYGQAYTVVNTVEEAQIRETVQRKKSIIHEENKTL